MRSGYRLRGVGSEGERAEGVEWISPMRARGDTFDVRAAPREVPEIEQMAAAGRARRFVAEFHRLKKSLEATDPESQAAQNVRRVNRTRRNELGRNGSGGGRSSGMRNAYTLLLRSAILFTRDRMFPRSSDRSSWSRLASRIPTGIYSIVVSLSVAVLGHTLLANVNKDERLNIVGAAIFATIGLILVELRERSQIARLLSILEKARGDNWLVNHLETIVELYTAVSRTADELFLGRVREQILDTVGQISETAEGHIDVPPIQESVFTIELVSKCLHTMDAISIQDEAWWSSPFGQQYLKRHVTALTHGVKIRRVFVMPSDHETRAQLFSAMTTQDGMGIAVRAITEGELRPEQRRDIVVYDGRYVRFGGEGEPRKALLSRNTDDIAEAIDVFEDAWLRSHKFTDFAADRGDEGH
jgi:hypothetical protein